MTTPLPAHGARFSFELTAADGAEIVYRVTLALADATWQGVGRIGAQDGAVTLEGLEGAPAWTLDAARAFLRGLWNGRRGPEPSRWPRRVTRWRASRQA